MARRTEGECPIATSIFIKKQAEQRGVSLNEVIKQYSEETGTPVRTVERWVWPATVKNEGKEESETNTGGNGELEKLEKQDLTHGGARKGSGRKKKPAPPIIWKCMRCDGKYLIDEPVCPKCDIHYGTEAMEFAGVSISQLERIRADDPERTKAFRHVSKWIAKNIR